ncbi:hypothetical protein FA13DRAFT_1732654 [Coprinellus micaceus]|uniref:Uncharacterized protein n=1 Tax=Coprinellus micaceus TaxID=71717 RepID=A0A4Y7TAK3_COPMI|nr:hypothetical protein FA13DRAFT_1732654 [Coprinellus micaceus]
MSIGLAAGRPRQTGFEVMELEDNPQRAVEMTGEVLEHWQWGVDRGRRASEFLS